MTQSTCKFSIGQLVHHLLFDYRGVIVDVDATFQGTEEWYGQMARSRPPKDEPWYHVLVDQAEHTTYVAERNLEPDKRDDPIAHPLCDHFFSDFENGQYICKLN
jgi:heat shock protein HspQ